MLNIYFFLLYHFLHPFQKHANFKTISVCIAYKRYIYLDVCTCILFLFVDKLFLHWPVACCLLWSRRHVAPEVSIDYRGQSRTGTRVCQTVPSGAQPTCIPFCHLQKPWQCKGRAQLGLWPARIWEGCCKAYPSVLFANIYQLCNSLSIATLILLNGFRVL